MNESLSTAGMSSIRIITGALMAYHGMEVFHAAQLQTYTTWDSFKNLPAPLLWIYAGKGGELISGLLLAIGFKTRWAGLWICINMMFICFHVGQGKFYYEDQHPFLFALLGMVYLSYGSGKWSLDYFIQQQKQARA